MKKILSFILAALMTASCAAYVAADDAAVEETTSNAAQDYAIEFLANYGIFKGYSAEDTGADDDIQRYQMALFVSRISTGWVEDEKWEDGTANNATFKDIEEGAAANYLGAISYANQNGIIEGYTANTFAPYDNITYRDALTMVVRTLGYKGLTYPWGYIQKAVELELTEGIGSDVAYTDNLTRGEVATIIYNAMFANTAKGNTLAKSIFDIDFKWQNIVVVSTDEYTTVANNDGAVYAKEGYVGFKTIDAKTAALGDKVYYVKSEELGLAGHEEELAVGSVFTALFEAVDGNFVTLVDADSAKIAEIFNNGITDNAGKAYETMPIAAALADADYELVKNYTNGYVNYTYNDLKVFGYDTVTVYDVDGNVANVGIDYATNNIVVWNAEDEAWEIAWFYNKTLNKYYKYVVDTKNSTTNKDDKVYTSAEGNVYINWMSDDEFTKWYNEVIKEAVASYSELTLLEKAGDTMLKGKAPYSKLSLFDIDNDGIAEVANYKDYAIGKFVNSTKECGKNAAGVNHADGKKYPTYKITTLDDATVYEQFVEADHDAHEDAHKAQFAWVNVDPSVTTFVKEDGTYTDGVVVYRVNETTGEIEIVKHIIAGEGDDADSYITTGILQAYNTAKKTLTINGTAYDFDYDNLAGDMLAMADTGIAERTRIGAMLDEMYMQYVTIVVCDGKVVDVDLLGADKDFIVVLGYAGVTSDGYIAVYGYSTDDVAMKVFKINSFNGWKKGDYRYNPSNATEDKAFDFGTLYQIKSYDEETQSYGVYTDTVSSVLASATPVKVTFDDGYRVIQPMTIKYSGDTFYYEVKKDAEPTVTKMDAKDSYVVVTNATKDSVKATSNIFTYSGIVKDADNGSFCGLLVNTGVDKKFVIYTSENAQAVPFFADNAYQIGYVLYEKTNGSVLNAAYDEAIAGDYYLLGSTLSEVRAMNLLTGNRDYVFASSNIDLLNGHIYKTIGGQIIADITDECTDVHGFVKTISEAYAADVDNLNYATYVVEMHDAKGMTGAQLFVDSDKDGKLDTMNTLELAKAMGFVTGTESYATAKAKELVKGVTLYVVGEDSFDWYATGYHGATTVSALAAKDVKADYTYYVDFVYEVASGKLVGYIFDIADKAEGIIAPDASKTFTGTVNAGNGETVADRYFDVEAKYTVTATYDDKDCLGNVKSLKLNELVLTMKEAVCDTKGVWTTKDLEKCAEPGCALHNALANAGVGFGGDDFADKNIYVGGEKISAKNIEYKAFDCGYVYSIVIDLTDADISVDDIHGLAGWMSVNVQVGDTTADYVSFYMNFTNDYLDDANNTLNGIDCEMKEVYYGGKIDLNVEAPKGDIIVLG